MSDGKVYLLTPDLVTHCLDANTGRPIWKRDLMKQHHGRNIGWNSAASVAVDGNLVFVGGGGPGESMLGLNKNTGAVVWKTGDETITHSTPVVATIHGQRQVIFFMKSGLVSVDVKNGNVLWKFPFHFSVSTAISPVVSGDIVYLSAGYGVGSAACRIEKQGGRFTATKLWFSPGNEPVVNHWSTPVCKDGYLYGMFGFKKFKKGPMKCVELATGKVMWSHPGFGQGNVILVGNRLVALAEDGNLVIVEATPDAYKEIARTKAFQDKCWSTPAFADGKIYVRSISARHLFRREREVDVRNHVAHLALVRRWRRLRHRPKRRTSRRRTPGRWPAARPPAAAWPAARCPISPNCSGPSPSRTRAFRPGR